MRARCTPWQTMWWLSSGAGEIATILATVQMRWRSSGPGSSTSAFRCSRIPTGRCSRNACCAAAIDFGRPIVIGRDDRWKQHDVADGDDDQGVGRDRNRLRIRRRRPKRVLDRQGTWPSPHTDFDSRNTTHPLVAKRLTPYRPVGQCNAAFEPTLRKLKTMDAGIVQLRRQYPVAADDQDPALDDGFHLFGIDPGQRHENQKLVFGLQDVDRGLPARLASFGRRLQAE